MKDGLYETPPAPPLTTWLLAAMLPMTVVANYIPESDMFVGGFVLTCGFIAARRVALWAVARAKAMVGSRSYRA